MFHFIFETWDGGERKIYGVNQIVKQNSLIDEVTDKESMDYHAQKGKKLRWTGFENINSLNPCLNIFYHFVLNN